MERSTTVSDYVHDGLGQKTRHLHIKEKYLFLMGLIGNCRHNPSYPSERGSRKYPLTGPNRDFLDTPGHENEVPKRGHMFGKHMISQIRPYY